MQQWGSEVISHRIKILQWESLQQLLCDGDHLVKLEGRLIPTEVIACSQPQNYPHKKILF